jgi:hypothetical protein
MTPADRHRRRYLIRSQKHDINHKKTKVNEMAKDFCEIDNNGGMSGERGLSPDKSVQHRCQAGGHDETQDNNRCRQRKL